MPATHKPHSTSSNPYKILRTKNKTAFFTIIPSLAKIVPTATMESAKMVRQEWKQESRSACYSRALHSTSGNPEQL